MHENQLAQNQKKIPAWTGLVLFLIGVVVFLELQLATGWLFYFPFCILGASIFISAYKEKHEVLTIIGILITSLSVGTFFLLSPIVSLLIPGRVGCFFISVAVGWLISALISYIRYSNTHYWAIFLGMTFLSTGLCFRLTALRFLDFVLYIGLGLGLGMLLWGSANRLIGLIIPGCLVGSTAIGVYLGWNPITPEPNALARTGVMLVVLGFGWAMITLFSKRVFTSVLWWPLIPALVISGTGWGLYIGGNPTEAGRFIGNTGSATLMILGIYVLLLRQGFDKK